jgi:preprotein translocase subunit SecG
LDLFLDLAQIIISVALIVLILLQSRGGGLGGLFGGGDTSIYRTRRGVEKTLFNLTIVTALAFFLVAIINVIVSG